MDCIVPSLDGTYRLSYVQLPVLLKWQFFGGNAASIHAVIGPSLDVLQDTHITTETLHRTTVPNGKNKRGFRNSSSPNPLSNPLQFQSPSLQQIAAPFNPAPPSSSIDIQEEELH